MTTVVERPDLSTRKALSKSVLGSFDLCATKAWYQIHDPRPFVTNEKVTFGSAVDAAVEVIIKYVRSGQTPDLDQATAAAEFIIERDDARLAEMGYGPTGVDILDVQAALAAFARDVVPNVDFTLARTQASITVDIPSLGECNGHPDVILADNSIFDVKTSSRAKDLPSVELGFYAVLIEAETGKPVPTVGYWNWVRAKRPFWQIASAPVTDELRRWATAKARAYVLAKQGDDWLNDPGEPPENRTMTGGPKFDGLCRDCPWNPALGGPCAIVPREEEAA